MPRFAIQKILPLSLAKISCLLLLLCGNLISVYSQQIPTQQQLNELVPGITEPTQMTKAGFENYFKDNNQRKNTGADKNKEATVNTKVQETKMLDKDSTQPDNYKKNSNRPDDTYGAYIFKNAAMNDVSELSTPPLDYPIGVGDHIIVSLWGGGEYQEDYIVARDGAIFPSGLGKITVQGLTFETAQKLIYARFSSKVPAGSLVPLM